LWNTEADAKGYEANGTFKEVVAKFGDLIQAAPVRELYEVGVQETR
jgi:hypothetical protein